MFDPNSEYRYFTKYDAFWSHIFNYACLRRKAYCYRRGSKLWKNCMYKKHSWKWLVRWIHISHPQPPGSAPSHKLQTPSKESGIFQSLGITCSFLLKGKVERGAWHNAPLNTLLGRCPWSMTKLNQWWRAYCVFAYHQHNEQKLSTTEFRKLH